MSISPASPIAIIASRARVREERNRTMVPGASDVSETGAQRTAGDGVAPAATGATAPAAAAGVAYRTAGDGEGATDDVVAAATAGLASAMVSSDAAGAITVAAALDIWRTSSTVRPTRN